MASLTTKPRLPPATRRSLIGDCTLFDGWVADGLQLGRAIFGMHGGSSFSQPDQYLLAGSETRPVYQQDDDRTFQGVPVVVLNKKGDPLWWISLSDPDSCWHYHKKVA